VDDRKNLDARGTPRDALVILGLHEPGKTSGSLVGNDQTRLHRGEIDPLEAFKIRFA
jgi:hypothetical protein